MKQSDEQKHGASAGTAQERKSSHREELLKSRAGIIQAARDFARSIAGGDEIKFIHAFQIALDVAVSATRVGPGRSDTLAKVMGRGADLMPEQFYSDPAFVENTINLIEGDVLVLGGVPADDFPDCVAVGPDFNRWPCSGTLIAANAVLTARHCVSSQNYVFVGPNTNVYKEPYEVDKVVRYPTYSDRHHNDLAILFLKENVEQAEGVKPRPRATADMIDAATSVVVAGYGSTLPGGVGGEGERLKATLAIKSRSCTPGEAYQYGCYERLEMLAMGVDKNSCKGDSGGPAYIKAADNEWYLAGITSRPMGSGSAPCGGHIYVRVDRYEQWINEKLAAHPPKN